jgi:hypothetical protein
MVGIIQAALVLELPVHLPQVVSNRHAVAAAAHIDRAVIALTFGFLFVTWRRLRRAEGRETAEGAPRIPATS